MQGVPGRSNAFEIARRLGLSDIIIQSAQSWTDTDSDVNRIIENWKVRRLKVVNVWIRFVMWSKKITR